MATSEPARMQLGASRCSRFPDPKMQKQLHMQLEDQFGRQLRRRDQPTTVSSAPPRFREGGGEEGESSPFGVSDLPLLPLSPRCVAAEVQLSAAPDSGAPQLHIGVSAAPRSCMGWVSCMSPGQVSPDTGSARRCASVRRQPWSGSVRSPSVAWGARPASVDASTC